VQSLGGGAVEAKLEEFIVGRGQIRTRSPQPGSASILLSNGDGTFQAPRNFGVNAGATSVAVGDFNSDGRPDFAVGTVFTGSMDVLLGNGDGTFQPPQLYAVDNRWGYFRVIAADVNGDGHPDLVGSIAADSSQDYWTSRSTQGLGVALNKGDGTFGDVTIYDHAGSELSGVAAADFNRDGLADILTVNSEDNTFSILFAGPQLAAPGR
jgi:hypothetical protein